MKAGLEPSARLVVRWRTSDHDRTCTHLASRYGGLVRKGLDLCRPAPPPAAFITIEKNPSNRVRYFREHAGRIL